MNSNPEDMVTPVLQALWNHPLVGGISAGAMMQPSAVLLNGNEIGVGLATSGSAIRIGENLMNNHGAGFIVDQFTIHSHFSERGYQGILPVALIQRPEINWAAGVYVSMCLSLFLYLSVCLSLSLYL
jgi:cyanophycinase-like exopeptidase